MSEVVRPTGNTAAIRETLVAVKKSIDGIGASSLDCDPEILMASLTLVCARLSSRIEAALAAPPRQCDVGTAAEQIKRWEKYCQEHHEYWKPDKSLTAIQRCNCPCLEGNGCNYFIWAQMPYEDDRAVLGATQDAERTQRKENRK